MNNIFSKKIFLEEFEIGIKNAEKNNSGNIREPIFFNGTSKKSKEFINSGEIKNVSLSKNVISLHEAFKKVKNG